MLDKLYINTCGNPFLTIIEILKAGHVKERGFIELTVCVCGGGSQVWHLSRAPYFGAHHSARAVAGMHVSGSPYIARRENRNEVGVAPGPPAEPNLLSPPVLTENQVLCTRTFAHLRHSCIIAV